MVKTSGWVVGYLLHVLLVTNSPFFHQLNFVTKVQNLALLDVVNLVVKLLADLELFQLLIAILYSVVSNKPKYFRVSFEKLFNGFLFTLVPFQELILNETRVNSCILKGAYVVNAIRKMVLLFEL